MAMGAAAPTVNPDPGSLPAKVRYGRAPKPSPQAAEVGVSSQEAVEYAINYAKQQRQLQEVQTGSQQHHEGRGRRLSGPECEKHYHAVTKTQPRQLTADSPFADVEIVADSWTKQSFSGIRALPQCLEPGFRRQALYDTVIRGKQDRQRRAQQGSTRLTASCPAFAESPSLRASHYVPSSTMRPSSWHVHPDNFGVWPYISSEYSRERDEAAKQRRRAAALRVSDHDFIVPSTVLPVKGTCCFSQYNYDLCPYPTETKSKQSSQVKDRQKGVPFYPPGYLHYPTDLLRSRFSRAECLAELEQELAVAWPQTFLQSFCEKAISDFVMAPCVCPPLDAPAFLQIGVFENGASFVVASFDAALAEQEGDLMSYMNELARLNSVPGSWQLCKSTANWGQVQGGIIHFTLKPTWVSSKVPVPATLSGRLPAVQPTSSHV